jgi:threonine aldolase
VEVMSVGDRQPSDSGISVVFRGDGDINTARDMALKILEFDREFGLEIDSYSRKGVVEQMEKRFAEMLGKEASIFMPSGTLANHLAIRKHCGLKPRAIVQEQSHIYNDTGDCVAQLSGINLVPLAKNRVFFILEELREAIERSKAGRVMNPVGAMVVESPVRRQAGQIVPFEEMRRITDYSRGEGIPTHLDGARLYMMSAATGINPQRYTAIFDTVYVSLYKYFGAPFGAILAGSSEFVEDLYHTRRMFGGCLSSAFMAAALALKGSEGFEKRFSTAMNKAVEFFKQINTLNGIEVGRYEHGSNIFPVKFDSEIDPGKLVLELRRRWVFVYADEGDPEHYHLSVNTTILNQSNADLLVAFEDALTKSR